MNRPVEFARGPAATIYSGWYAGKPVAWKVFPARFDRRTLAAVRRDQARLAALAAAIRRVDGVERWENRHALRMELCAESLAARIRRAGPLPPAEVMVLGHSLALALAAAHRVGVLHGAVNPDNVLFRASGPPVLAEFGVALRETFPRDPLHGVAYVSPETLRTGTVTEQSDLYGFGAVLHVALTGRSPHPGQLGEQPGERVLRVLRTPVPAISRSDVPVGFAAVIARLLAAEVTHRPRTAAAVVSHLAEMLPRPPDSDTDPFPRAVPTGRSRGRQLVASAVALLALLAVVLGLGLPTTSTGEATPRTTAPSTATLVNADIELSTPQDFTDHVLLRWTSRRSLYFWVVVRTDGGQPRYLDARRRDMFTIPVDPARRYCFLVRGTDGNRVYQSRTVAIRGAHCAT